MVAEQMQGYFCDMDKSLSWWYAFTYTEPKSKHSHTKFWNSPYIIELHEKTNDFYQNVRDSLKIPVAKDLKERIKTKDKEADIHAKLRISVKNTPEFMMFSCAPQVEGDWRFKFIPNEFDLKEFWDEEEKSENLLDLEIDENDTVYYVKNIITYNKESQFFEMIFKEDGEWAGYAQGSCFDDNKFFSLDYKIPGKGEKTLTLEEATKDPNTLMNYFFVELFPVFVIYEKKSGLNIDKKKYTGKQEFSKFG